MKPSLILSVMLCAVSGMAKAEISGSDATSVSTRQTQESRWGLGLGAAVSSGVYAGEGTQVTPFPLISYDSERFFWRGIAGGAHLFKRDDFAIDATLSARMDGIDRSDFGRRELAERGIDRSLLEDRDDAIDLGIAATWTGDLGQLELDVKGDISNATDGYEAGLKYGYPMQWGKNSITPNVGISFLSKKLANYYYGTLPVEVDRGVIDYRPGSATVQHVGLDFVRPFADRWAFIANVSYEHLPGKITDSPLVDEDTNGSMSAFFGISRGF
ncbi:MipA/OmpV family protein [Pseudomonas sp. Ant30-3]|uniref:MipA/OmpV family protein n=1 Tax=Pseudomonas sp. Ant30-3 TaxID=1488328 RepID=UPI0009DF2897|nr:MipA/OmpV family protein [Pseudomonas sp. Ant30-3]